MNIEKSSCVVTIVSLFFVLCISVNANEIMNENGFNQAVQKKVKAYKYDDKKHREYLLNGEYQKSIQTIEGISKEKNAVDYFVLGNVFYKTDVTLSMQYHKKAYDALPHIPAAQLEMAYQYHRQNNCKDALPLYQKLDKAGWIKNARYALLAHCYLQVGEYTKAFEHWVKTDFSNHHTGVDFTIFEIFGELSPLIRYSKLMEGIKIGNAGYIGPIIDLSISWDKNWWNVSFNQEAYEKALHAIKKEWPESSGLGKEIRIMEEIRGLSEPIEVETYLNKYKLVLHPYGLPVNSYVAKTLITKAIQADLITAQDIYKHHATELLKRVKSAKKDIYALDLMAFTYLQMEMLDELDEIDKIGWKKYKKVNYAKSYLISYARKNDRWPPYDDELFVELIRDFPNEPYFRVQQFIMASKSNKASPRMLKGIINAEYHGLLSNKSRYARDLNSFYHHLNKLIEKKN